MSVNRCTPEYRAALATELRDGGIELVVIDHLQMVWALEQLTSHDLPVVYVSHNHEGSVRRGVAAGERHPLRRAALSLDAERAARSERRLAEAACVVTAISETDANLYRRDGVAKVITVPPGYSGRRRPTRSIDHDTPRIAIVVTNLDWHVKRTNLRRLLDAADARFARSGIELRIVGPIPDDFVRELSPRLLATTFVGRVESLADELDRARVGIIAERDGGGFKLKTLDYVFGRVPMAALEGSVAGLPLEPDRDFVQCDTEVQLAERVVALIDDVDRCQELQQRSYDRCSGAFDWDDRGAALAAGLTEALVA